jgi:hypothetical protein
VKGTLICESKPTFGVFTTKGLVGCRQGTKKGEQQFTTALNSSGVDTTDQLVAEATVSFFKTTENDSQSTHELVSYSKEILQSL